MKIAFAALLATSIFVTPAFAETNWNKVCASYYLTPGTAEFKDCVAKMSDADKATNGTLMQDDGAKSPAADRERGQMQSDADRQRAQMRAEIDRDTADLNVQGSNCVTTVHGTNKSTVCSPAPQQRLSQYRSERLPPPPQQSQPLEGQPQPQQGAADIVGTWSGGTQQFGVAFAFNPDGSYVSVSGGGTGLSQRLWGRYRVTPVSASTVHIEFQVMGWAPRELCSQVIGGARACGPYRPIYSNSAMIAFNSPSSFTTQGGGRFNRDPSPYLLQMQVPNVFEKQIAGMGGIRQPVMPTLHPYQTPGGAGSVAAMRNDDEHQQPYRVCSVNGGSVYTDQRGVQHCTN